MEASGGRRGKLRRRGIAFPSAGGQASQHARQRVSRWSSRFRPVHAGWPDLNDTGPALGSRNPDKLIFSMMSMTIQVRGRGTLTLPASLREKYRLGEGDPLTVVDLDGAVLLSPRVLVVPLLAAEMERLRRARKLSLKDLGGPARED